MRSTFAALSGLALALAATTAPATEVAAFDIWLGGLRVAELVIAGEVRDGRYAAAADLRTTGLAAALRRVSFAARVTGLDGPDGPRPTRSSEAVDTGRRQSRVALVWQGDGVRHADTGGTGPATAAGAPMPAAGAVDPLTALFYALRDVAQADLCRFAATTFDGTRRAEARLDPLPGDGHGDGQGDGPACAGRFRRVSGYPPEEVARRPEFGFRIHYAPAEDGRLRAVRIETETLYGQAVLKRR